MDDAEFSWLRWDHWLLVASFVAIAFYGLQLSHQWKREAKQKQVRRMKARLMRQLELSHHTSQQSPLPSQSRRAYIQKR